jgi:diguanylate cyclase (GGDEF)-like protein
MLIRTLLIFIEVLFITLLNYYMAESYYSLDVLYCLPVIQTARFDALQVQRSQDYRILTLVAIFCAIAWSLAEAAVSWPDYPMSAFLMNVVTRGVTFTLIGRVIARLWKDKEYSRKDWLTGLPDRVELIRLLEMQQLLSERTRQPFSLLCININRFRALNDKHGHQAWDEALKLLAALLQGSVRSGDAVARTGSDEFIVLLAATDEQACMNLGERVVALAERRFMEQGWDISLSCGHVTATGRTSSMDDILRDAGQKLYLSKLSGKAGPVVGAAGAEA